MTKGGSMNTAIRRLPASRLTRWLFVPVAAAVTAAGLAAPAWAGVHPGVDAGTLQHVVTLASDSDSGSTCALLSTGHVDCWGYNGDGELGNGTTTNSDVPVAVHGITDAKAIAEDNQDGNNGGSFCALLTTGHIDCWGYNNDGQLGNGTTTTFTLPVAVKNITTAAAVIGGNYSFCALLADSHLDCWGYNGYGELGNGNMTNSDVPVAVRKITNAAHVISGNYGYCALLSTSHMECWGYNGDGELGNGNMTNSDVPVAVEKITNAKAMASDADSGSTCVLLTTSHIDCWGYNNDGQLGDGTTTSSDVPVAVVSLTNANGITEDSNGGSGGGSFCALLSTSHLKCWGYNADGELGNGNTTNFTIPVAVKNISTASVVTGGDFSFCALLVSSHSDCWGYNADGELGNGNMSDSDVPVAVRKITNATLVNMGNYGYCALLSTTSVDCWGYGGHGELGDGNTSDSDVPVAVRAVS
jgi:alpha-tubulin suppressor-like RCC1 family protein